MSQELQAYIAQARKKGFSDAQIYDQLIAAGWNAKDVAESLGMKMPLHNGTTNIKDKNLLVPVSIRIVAIVLLILAFVVVYIIFGAIGGSPLPLSSLFWVVFFYIPITLLILSTISLLSGKGSRSFDFLPESKAKKILNKASVVIGIIIIISVIMSILVEIG